MTFNPTTEQRNRIVITAKTLWHRVWPEDMDGFDMKNAFGYNECGSVCCVLGLSYHLFPGIEARQILNDDADFLAWVGAPHWVDRDNTPRGAAKRLLWAIEFGIPDNYPYQILGKAPLCYSDWTPEIFKEEPAKPKKEYRVIKVSETIYSENLITTN